MEGEREREILYGCVEDWFSLRFVCYHQMSVHLSVLIVQTRATQVIIYLHKQCEYLIHPWYATACGVGETTEGRIRSDYEGF